MNTSRGALFRPENDRPESPAGALYSKLFPELSILVLLVLLILAPQQAWWIDRQALEFGVMADGATLMLSATLIDVASRLQRAPPWWLVPIIVTGLFLAYPEAWQMLTMGWSLGIWCFLPFAWSILERLREMWTLPRASRIEKIRRRTLTFDRLYTALVLGGLWIGAGLLWLLVFGAGLEAIFDTSRLEWLLLAFYAINVGNVIRVHRPAFQQRPRSLLPWIDGDQASYLDPL
jgi:hypothetical protein